MIPGEWLIEDGEIELNAEKECLTLRIENRGDRPVQVGSHTHFFEVNAALSFDRELAYGHRLDVPAGTALRFEPGEGRLILLVPFGGNRIAYGMNALVSGSLADKKDAALKLARDQGYIEEIK
jgi:urease beta subunit